MSEQLRMFLDLIAWSEGTSVVPITRCNGYDVIVSGPDGFEVFDNFSEHPFEARKPKVVRPAANGKHALLSSASGRYQIVLPTWRAYRTILAQADFSAASQDAVALRLIRDRRAIDDVEAGNIASAITKCSNIWASFPAIAMARIRTGWWLWWRCGSRSRRRR